MATPTAFVTHTIGIREASKGTFEIQFEEHDKVYRIFGNVLHSILYQVERFPNTGKAIDALRQAADQQEKQT